MHTTKPIRIHSKCLSILELIQQSSNRINHLTADLNIYDNDKDCYSLMRLMHKREWYTESISKYKKIKVFLVTRYLKAINELQLPTENVVFDRYNYQRVKQH